MGEFFKKRAAARAFVVAGVVAVFTACSTLKSDLLTPSGGVNEVERGDFFAMMIDQSEVMLFDPVDTWTGDMLADDCVKAVFKWALAETRSGRKVLWGSHANFIYARAARAIMNEEKGEVESLDEEQLSHLLLSPIDDRVVEKLIFSDRQPNGSCSMQGLPYSIYSF